MTTLFFDRSVGKRIPEALLTLRLPINICYHQQYFATAEQDDVWLAQVGAWKWFVIGQDWSYHFKIPELSAIKQYNIGCFYLWGAEDPMWQTMRCFARAYDRILAVIESIPTPFIYRVTQSGLLRPINIP